MSDYKKIMPPPPKTGDYDLNKVIEGIRRALKEVYKELDRLESKKQDK